MKSVKIAIKLPTFIALIRPFLFNCPKLFFGILSRREGGGGHKPFWPNFYPVIKHTTICFNHLKQTLNLLPRFLFTQLKNGTWFFTSTEWRHVEILFNDEPAISLHGTRIVLFSRSRYLDLESWQPCKFSHPVTQHNISFYLFRFTIEVNWNK